MDYSFKGANKSDRELLIDAHNIGNGCFYAAIAHPSLKRIKMKVIKDKNNNAIYDLKNNGTFELFPLQFGDGNYQISLYENISGTKYVIIGNIKLNVRLDYKNNCFLVPNQYINYHQLPQLINFTHKLCENKTKEESITIIQRYIKNNGFSYDAVKAMNIKKGSLPDILKLLETKRGICFDFAALVVAMFRIQGIPSKLIIGDADGQYHAWVEIIGLNKTILYDPTFELYDKKIKKYIPERYY